MALTVIMKPGASADVERIVGFIARRVSPMAAARWQAKITATIDKLASDATMWPEADEAADLGIDLRCRPHGGRHQVYRILYTYDAQNVTIQRILHAAQDRLTEDDF